MTNLVSSGLPTEFETGNLLVRRYRLDDDDALYGAARASIAEIHPFLPWCHPDYAMTDAREWLAQITPSWVEGIYTFGIFDRSGRDLLGSVGLSPVDEHPVANLGYWIRSDVTRRGVATEATVGLVRHTFAHLDLQRIEIIMSVRNLPSRRVAEKAGATFEGTLRSRLMLHGEAHDAHCFSLVRGDL
tara:strand:- start:6460 stop:7020 length:561 start_codon:yes stop_codon:yes gene_type:complete